MKKDAKGAPSFLIKIAGGLVLLGGLVWVFLPLFYLLMLT